MNKLLKLRWYNRMKIHGVAFPKKLVLAQLVKKTPTFYGT